MTTMSERQSYLEKKQRSHMRNSYPCNTESQKWLTIYCCRDLTTRQIILAVEIANGAHSQSRTDKAIAKKVIVFGWETTCAKLLIQTLTFLLLTNKRAVFDQAEEMKGLGGEPVTGKSWAGQALHSHSCGKKRGSPKVKFDMRID